MPHEHLVHYRRVVGSNRAPATKFHFRFKGFLNCTASDFCFGQVKGKESNVFLLMTDPSRLRVWQPREFLDISPFPSRKILQIILVRKGGLRESAGLPK